MSIELAKWTQETNKFNFCFGFTNLTPNIDNLSIYPLQYNILLEGCLWCLRVGRGRAEKEMKKVIWDYSSFKNIASYGVNFGFLKEL